MPTSLNTGIVSILNEKRNRIEGTGFLVSKNLVVTCAHVIRDAGKAPSQEIQLQIRASKQTMTALIEPAYWKPPDQEDIAFLRLLQDKPEQEEILLLGSSSGTSGHFFETIGFPASLDEARGYGTIGGSVTLANRKLLQLTGATEITSGFSGAPVLDKQTRRVVGMVASIATPDKYGKLTETAFIIPSETLRAACEEIQLSDLCPYQSLDTFTEQNAEFFFGREEITQRILDKLRGKPRFLAILGPSGSGKSSLIQAGVIPQLRTGKVLGSEKWGIITTRPTDILLDAFRHQEQESFADGLSAYREWLENLTKEKHLLLVIDQFEELLIAEEKGAVQASLNLLTDLLDKGRNLTLLMVLRDDFYGRLSQMAPELLPWLEGGLINIPQTLSQNELWEIIENPGKSVGLEFETGLVDTLIRDSMEVTPGNQDTRRVGRSTTLPLLEFTLTQLWEKRADSLLTFQAYQIIGGVTGGLAQWAQDTFDALSEPQQQLARSILTSLVHLGDESQNLPDTRRRRPVQDLYRDFDEHQIDAVLERLTKARLIISFRDERQNQEYVEIVHEALIREWEALQNWLRDDQSFLRWRQEVESRAKTWANSNPANIENRDDGKLLRGKDLALAEDALNKRQQELDQGICDFIRAGTFLRDKEGTERETVRQRELEQVQKLAKEQQRRAQAQRQRSIYLTFGLMVAVLLSILSFSLFQSSNQNLEEANLANTQSIANANTAQAFSTQVVLSASTAEARRIEAENAQATAQGEAVTRSTAQAESEYQRQQAEVQAVVAHSGEVAALAINQIAKKLDLAILLSIEAFNTRDLHQTQNALFQVWSYNPRLEMFLHDNQSGHNLIWLPTQSKQITSLALSSDGMLASGALDGTIVIWDVLDSDLPTYGKPIEILQSQQDSLYSMAWSGNGQLATGALDDTIVIWNMVRADASKFREPFLTLTGISDQTISVAWSEDGFLASGDDNGTVTLWDLRDVDSPQYGQPTLSLQDQSSPIYSIAWSKDKYLASGAADGSIVIWDMASVTSPTYGKPVQIIQTDQRIRSIAWSTDGRLASGGANTIKIWTTQQTKPLQILEGNIFPVQAIAWSENGYLASGASDGTIIIWDTVNTNSPTYGQPLQKLQGHTSQVSSLLWLNNQRLASGALDGNIILWNLTPKQPLQTIESFTDQVISVAWSNDGRLALGSREGVITVLDSMLNKRIFTFKGQYGEVWSLAWSSDGRLASGTSDGTVIVWDLEDGKEELILQGHTQRISSLAWSEEGQLASGAWDSTINLWDTINSTSPTFGHPIKTLQDSSGVTGLAWSSDERLASGTLLGNVNLWDLELEKVVYSFQDEGQSSVIAWSEDGLLASGSSDGKIIVRDTKNISSPTFGKTIQVLQGQYNWVNSISWSTDGKLASGSTYGDVIVWDKTSFQPIILLKDLGISVFSIAWSPDGKLAFGTDKDGVFILETRPEVWLNQSCQRAGRNLTESEWNQYLSWKGPFDPTYKTCPQWPSAAELAATPTP